jgi:hypothetical protein
MSLYELVLRFPDRDEIRLADRNGYQAGGEVVIDYRRCCSKGPGQAMRHPLLRGMRRRRRGEEHLRPDPSRGAPDLAAQKGKPLDPDETIVLDCSSSVAWVRTLEETRGPSLREWV